MKPSLEGSKTWHVFADDPADLKGNEMSDMMNRTAEDQTEEVENEELEEEELDDEEGDDEEGDDEEATAAAPVKEDTRAYKEVPRIYKKQQGGDAPRTFSVGGPKAEKIFELIAAGATSRKLIAAQVGCSVARVGEVVWALEFAGVNVPGLTKADRSGEVIAL